MSSFIKLAVNGTLMRGLELNRNLTDAGAKFLVETTTAPVYRLWSINDDHPAMMRVKEGGVAVALEVWGVPPEGLVEILQQEPPGLCLGKITTADGEEMLGVLGEPFACDGQKDISRYGGWRAYIEANQPASG